MSCTTCDRLNKCTGQNEGYYCLWNGMNFGYRLNPNQLPSFCPKVRNLKEEVKDDRILLKDSSREAGKSGSIS